MPAAGRVDRAIGDTRLARYVEQAKRRLPPAQPKRFFSHQNASGRFCEHESDEDEQAYRSALERVISADIHSTPSKTRLAGRQGF